MEGSSVGWEQLERLLRTWFQQDRGKLMAAIDRFRLDGRVALISGGSRGLGRVMAEALASAGASVALTARDLDRAELAAQEIATATGREVIGVGVDVTKADQVEAAVATVLGRFGSLDILINNAGINIRRPIELLKEAEWDLVLDTNLKGAWLFCRAAVPAMKRQGWGRILNVSSMLGEVGLAERTPYCSSKGGLTLMTRTLALELSPFGINVNALCPGPFATEINLPLLNDPEKKAGMEAKLPIGRWGDPEELGPAAPLPLLRSGKLHDRRFAFHRRWLHGPITISTMQRMGRRFVSDSSELVIPSGFRAAGVKAGIKPSGLPDLAVIVADSTCSAAGAFTTNRIAAAPVQWDRAIVPSEAIRAIVINAGNANAATGAQGFENTKRTAEIAAAQLGCEPEHVLIASTGVIGHQLPMDRMEAGVRAALEAATEDSEGFHAASQAILTTDTRPKLVSISRTLENGRTIRLLGLAKGAAMIGPRMATMLGFLITDARVQMGTLQGILSEAVEETFNCISVEGHTSTNDSVLMLSGSRGELPLMGADLRTFVEMVREACESLAKMIPEDGEGATHLITVEVLGCRDRDQARQIARAVADSPLVKTAIHGADPNWGRIVSAAGYSGVMFDESELSLELDGVPLYRDGIPLEFDAAEVSRRMKSDREVTITLTLRQGEASIRFWTCDLTAEYVRLNADYTT